MKITKIEKKKRLYLLEFDQADRMYVTEDTIVRFMLSKDMTLSNQQLQEIKDFAQFSYGKNLALYYLSFKPRTEKEVKDYLLQHDIEDSKLPKILTNLREDSWIDDRKYAESLAQQNLSSGDKGAYNLRQKLLQKGINKATIEEVLESIDFSDLADKTAQKLLRKYQGKLPDQALKDKIIQSLVNKGFSFSEAKTACDSLAIERDEEDEERLIEQELDKLYPKYSKKYEGYGLKQHLTQALARKGFTYDHIAAALREYL